VEIEQAGKKVDHDKNQQSLQELLRAGLLDKFQNFVNDKGSNENIKNTGIEAEYALVSNKGFGYNVSASYGNPKTQSIDKNNHDFGWQKDNNKFELKAGLTYRMDKWKAALNAAYVAGRHGFSTTSVSKKVKVPYVTNFDAKAYLLTNLNIEYQAQKDLSFFATINNIFDRDDVVFFSNSAEYYATPVNFLIGMKYSF
jgi:iron complex outermembrane receptor protein